MGILSGVALGALRNAETRSKLAQARTDMRILARAMEDYWNDWEAYPPTYSVGLVLGDEQIAWTLPRMTTPVAYLSRTSFINPFGKNRINRSVPLGTRPVYMQFNYEPIDPDDFASIVARERPLSHRSRSFMVWSVGPSQDNRGLWNAGTVSDEASVDPYRNLIYDPSNGTLSNGDLGLVGGDFPLPQLGLESQ